jgi:hypothetical protein
MGRGDHVFTVQVLLKKLKRIQKAALEVQKLSQQTIAIMKSYNKPPDVVVQVRAVLDIRIREGGG